MFPIWTSNSFLLLKNVIIYIKINSWDEKKIMAPFSLLRRTTVARSANFKMVWYVLLRPLRPKLDGQDLV
jgi:hypothetical protein